MTLRSSSLPRAPLGLLAVIVLAVTVLAGSGCAPDAPTPRGGPVTEGDHPPVGSWVVRVEGDGRLAGTIIDGPVRELEHLLDRPGPTTIDQLQALWTSLDGFAHGLRRNAEVGRGAGSHALPDDITRAMSAASEDVEALRDEVLRRTIRWSDESSLVAIERAWRPVANEHFAWTAERPAATRRDDRDDRDQRDERDPPADSDLREIVAELARLAADARHLEKWDHSFASAARQAIENRRPRPGLASRARIPFEPYATGSERPVELRRALRAIDDARAVLSDASTVPSWNEGERARRLADELTRHVERAEDALAELP